MDRYELISKIDSWNIHDPLDTFTTDDLFVIYSTQVAMAKLNQGLRVWSPGNFRKLPNKKLALLYEKAPELEDK